MPKAGPVQHVINTGQLEHFFKEKLVSRREPADQKAAVQAWLALSQTFVQDGMFQFSVPPDSIKLSRTDTDTNATGKAVITPAGGNRGEIMATLHFTSGGDLTGEGGAECSARRPADLPGHALARFRSDRARNGCAGPFDHGPGCDALSARAAQNRSARTRPRDRRDLRSNRSARKRVGEDLGCRQIVRSQAATSRCRCFAGPFPRSRPNGPPDGPPIEFHFTLCHSERSRATPKNSRVPYGRSIRSQIFQTNARR